MIKIFNANDKDFSTAGNIIINPTKCMEYKKKSLNGWYIEVEIPIKYKDYIEKDKLCVVKTKSKLNPQAFRIGNDIKKTNRKITFTANHVMFDTQDYFLVDVRPINQNGLNALNYINERTDNVSPFKIYSNVENVDTAYFIRKNLLEAWAIIEERWNGVFDADNWNISFLQSVGHDNGESIICGKNMQSMEIYEDWSSVVTRLYPVGSNELMLPEKYIESDIQYEKPYTRTVDFQTQIEQEKQTEDLLIEELRANAEDYIEENKYPKVSYTTTSDINDNMEIGDIIQVLHPLVSIKTEVLEYQYDIISKKIKSLTFGNFTRDVKAKFDNIKNTINQMGQALSNQNIVIQQQTNLINSLNKNGYVYIDDNEILILDQLPKEKAKNVWRFGLGGIGFSSNGYEGPFEIAITMDGQINADFITTGTMSVSRIEGLANTITDYNTQIAKINLDLGKITQSVTSVETKVETVETKADNAQSTADSANTNAQKAQETVEEVKSKTIYQVDVMYALSSSSTQAPTTGWQTTSPQWESGKYMWQKTVTTYGDGSTDESSATCITGAKGQDGTNGTNGAKGDTGIGVKSIEEQYYLSTSNTTQTGGSWKTTQDTWVSGKYIWTRNKITWTDNTTTYTTPILATGLNNANSVANTANSTANSANTTATNAQNTAEQAKSTADETSNNLKTNYYTKTETNSQITQKADEITSEVSKTYSTKTETTNAKNDAISSANASTDEKLKGYSTTTQMNSAITQKADEITQQINTKYDYLRETEQTNEIKLENTVEGQGYVLNLKIKGNSDKFIYLTPSETLTPSNTLVPLGDYFTIICDKQSRSSKSSSAEEIEVVLSEPLRSYNGTYDEINITNGKATVTRRIGVNTDLSLYVLNNEIIENLQDVVLKTFDSNSYIYVKEYQGLEYSAKYIIKSDYSEVFATQSQQDGLQNAMVEMKSSLTIAVEGISSTVSKKVGKDEIISTINQSAEEVAIDAEKLNINGVISANGNFEVDKDGTLRAVNAYLSGTFLNGGQPAWGEKGIQIDKDGSIDCTDLNIYSNNNTEGIAIRPLNSNVYNPNCNSYIRHDEFSIYKDSSRIFQIGVSLTEQNPYISMANGSLSLKYIIASDYGSFGNYVSATQFINSSKEYKKENIKKLKETKTKRKALDILKNIDICEYNFKDNKHKQIGVVIGEGYNTPDEILSEDKSGVDLYSMISNLYRAFQEYIEEQDTKIKNLEEMLKSYEMDKKNNKKTSQSND